MVQHAWKVLVLAVAVGFAGCDSTPRHYPVTGTVTLNQKPVAGASLAFMPQGDGPMGTATTDESGKFTVTSATGKPGLPPGSYKVGINKIISPLSNYGGSSPPTPEDMKAMAQSGGKAKGPRNELPEKYAQADSSGLTATVEADEQKNTFTFDLTP